MEAETESSLSSTAGSERTFAFVIRLSLAHEPRAAAPVLVAATTQPVLNPPEIVGRLHGAIACGQFLAQLLTRHSTRTRERLLSSSRRALNARICMSVPNASS